MPTLVVFREVSFPELDTGVAVLANLLSQIETIPSWEATANILDVELKSVEKDESTDPVKVA